MKQGITRNRQNLYRGLSRLMLSLARIPQTKIGCLRFNDDCSITLASPPLLCANTILESEGAPRTMHQPFSDAGRFLFGLLESRCEAFRAQPNAVHDEDDCRLLMSHYIMLHTLLAKGVERTEGPFVLQYTDLHASNLFVDEDWNIVGVIDLEFVCSLPPSMLDVLYWFSTQYIDGLRKCLEEHNRHTEDFLQVFGGEEIRFNARLPLGRIIRKAWVSGEFWIFHCLTSINAMPHLMEDHIWRQFGFQPSLSEETVFVRNLSHFWSEQSDDFVKQKVRDKKQYNNEVTALYNIIDPK